MQRCTKIDLKEVKPRELIPNNTKKSQLFSVNSC